MLARMWMPSGMGRKSREFAAFSISSTVLPDKREQLRARILRHPAGERQRRLRRARSFNCGSSLPHELRTTS